MSDTPEKIDLSVIGQYLAAKLEASKKEIGRLEAENARQVERLDVMEEELDAWRQSEEKLESQIQSLGNQVADKDKEIERLEAMLGDARVSMWKIYSITTGQYEGEDDEMGEKESILIQKESRKMFDILCALSKLTPSGALKGKAEK